MTELDQAESDERPIGRPRLRDIAREEFWIVAKSFFAPIYGTLLVWRRLLRLTRRLDRRAFSRQAASTDEAPSLSPAE